MKKLSLLLFLLTSTLIICQEEMDVNLEGVDTGATLTIIMKSLKSDDGKAYAALYDTKESWLKDFKEGGMDKINSGVSTVIITNVKPGKYAVSCFHDENDNDEMDTGWFGIPTEPYACSRGAKGTFGPPKWKDAVFEMTDEDQTITINF